MFKFIVMTVCVIACAKVQDNLIIGQSGQVQETKLIGKWAWLQSSGGFAGKTVTPESEGITRSIEISADRVKFFENNQLIQNLAYTIVDAESIFGPGKTKQIKFENGQSNMTFNFEGNANSRLVLSEECYDCFRLEYQKIQE